MESNSNRAVDLDLGQIVKLPTLTPNNKFKGPSPRTCGCKGIRTCLLCDPSKQQSSETEETRRQEEHGNVTATTKEKEIIQETYKYCLLCGKAWLTNHHSDDCNGCRLREETTYEEVGYLIDGSKTCHHMPNSEMDFPGIHIFKSFVNEEEEHHLDQEILKTAFVNSQSGRRKQDFGPKVNFKKKKLKTANFNGLPFYSEFLYRRMRSLPVLCDFRPVEMCNLEYLDERGAHIDPHFDDFWLWGERLVTLNLISDTFLTFTLDSCGKAVRVPMPRRSLIVVSGPARHTWKHSIDSKDIHGRRLAITFRELSAEFQEAGARHKEGQELLDMALTFKGQAIGS